VGNRETRPDVALGWTARRLAANRVPALVTDRGILTDTGATMADIVKLNIYIVAEVDPAALPKMRAIRDRYVKVQKPPASTLVVVVSCLARPGWLLEIEAVAAID